MFDQLSIDVAATDAPPALADQAEQVDAAEPMDPGLAAELAREWADCSGAILAKLIADALPGVADLPDDLSGDQQIFDLITANARVAAWATANQARLTALVHQRAHAEHEAFGLVQRDGSGSAAGASHYFDDDLYTTSEIAANLSLELGWSMPVAQREVEFGLGLARDEDVRLALAVGRLDVAQAKAVIAELDHVPEAAVREPIVAALVTDPQTPGADQVLVKELRPGRRRLWDLPPAELRSIIRREATRREPDVAEIRLLAARSGRHVRFVPRRDGMADLTIHGPAEILAAAYQHLDLSARATKRQHGRRPEIAGASLDELRHDIALGALTQGDHGVQVTFRDQEIPVAGACGAAGVGDAIAASDGSGATGEQTVLRRRPRVQVNITVADTTLLGLDELPATLHSPAGPVPIPADLARQLAYDPEQATWRSIWCDPRTGVATDVSRGYTPAPRIAEFVKIRDGHRSRFPGSNATHLELDHVTAYRHDDPGAGGPTTASNLASDGQQDHHLKTDGALKVTGDASGPLRYTGRSGRAHLSWPHQYVDPAPDAQGVRADSSEHPPDSGDPPY